MQDDQNSQANPPKVYSTSHYVDGDDSTQDSTNTNGQQNGNNNSSNGSTSFRAPTSDTKNSADDQLDAPNPYPDRAYPEYDNNHGKD
jgi:hypothetical protein